MLNANDQKVLNVLSERHRPMSAYDILDAVKGTALKAPVQIYRSLEKLIGIGQVHRVEMLNAFVVCACEHEDAAPGFFLCKTCGEVTEFDSQNASGLLVSMKSGYRIERVSVELSGTCPNCQILTEP